MRKAVYCGIRDLRVEEVEEPKPGAGEAKVRVRYCGICGSDLHEYLHGPFPVSSFGHEVCGEVVEIGAGVERVAVGDHVVVFNRDGYAEYQVAPESRLLKLPESLSWKRAAVLEPLAGAAYAVQQGRLQPGQTVLIAGAGPVGLMVLLAARALGVETIYVTETSAKRRDLARRLGATDVLDPGEAAVPPRMRELTDGRGVDVAVEAVGIAATLKDCLASTRQRGTVVVQGIFTDRVPIHMLGFVTREVTMIGTNSLDAAQALDWITSGRVEPETIVTSIVPLERIQPDGFEVLTRDKDRDVKILVQP